MTVKFVSGLAGNRKDMVSRDMAHIGNDADAWKLRVGECRK